MYNNYLCQSYNPILNNINQIWDFYLTAFYIRLLKFFIYYSLFINIEYTLFFSKCLMNRLIYNYEFRFLIANFLAS